MKSVRPELWSAVTFILVVALQQISDLDARQDKKLNELHVPTTHWVTDAGVTDFADGGNARVKD